MTQSRLYFTVIFCLYLAGISCRHKGGSCRDLPVSDSWTGYQFVPVGPQYRSPVFIPGTNDKFIYVKLTDQKGEINSHDIAANSERNLMQGLVYGNQAVSKEHVIYPNPSDGQLWKINVNTLENTRFASYPDQCQYPAFKNDSEIAFVYDPYTVADRSYRIVDLQNNLIDSIKFLAYGYADWGKTDWYGEIFCFIGGDGIYTINAQSKAANHILTIDKVTNESDIVKDIAWSIDGKYIFYCKMDGIFKVNVDTKKWSRVKTGCSTKEYHTIDISSDGTRLISQRIDRKKIDETKVEEYYHIYIMNIDGSHEQQIF